MDSSHANLKLKKSQNLKGISLAVEVIVEGIIYGILNALWKICCLVVNGQSFLVIDGYLLNLYKFFSPFSSAKQGSDSSTTSSTEKQMPGLFNS